MDTREQWQKKLILKSIYLENQYIAHRLFMMKWVLDVIKKNRNGVSEDSIAKRLNITLEETHSYVKDVGRSGYLNTSCSKIVLLNTDCRCSRADLIKLDG